VCCLIADVSEHCLFHLHRRVDMKCVRLESYVLEADTDKHSPSGGGGGCLQVVVRWWILMTGVVVRVNKKPLYTFIITIQKVTSNAQSVPRQSPETY
jgi:hypothetical protein